MKSFLEFDNVSTMGDFTLRSKILPSLNYPRDLTDLSTDRS